MHELSFAGIVIIAFCAPLFSQAPIQGTVFDPTGRRVQGAVIECQDRRATSGFDGTFRIEGPDECKATVTRSGFEEQQIDLKAGAGNRVDLDLAGVVERVVVTATRSQTTAEAAGVAVNVITAGEIKTQQSPMVADLLRELPGIHVVRSGRYGALSAVFTRGAQRTGTLVLIDGVPMNDPGGELNFGHLTSSSLERIEVVRGPESALFGAEASAGVIQLFTRRGDPERTVPHGTFSYERGTFQTDRWVAGLSGGSGERLDYSLNAEQFHSVGEFTNDYYRNTTGSANVGYRFSPATEFRGTYRSFDAALGVPGQVHYGLVDHDAHETARDSLVSARIHDARGSRFVQQFGFGYHRQKDVFTDFGMDGPYELALLVRDVRTPVPRVYREAILDARNLPSTRPPGTRLITQSVTLYPFDPPFVTLHSRKEFQYQGNLAHTGGSFVFGYDYERQQGNVSERDVARNNHGVFLHEQYTIGRRVFLSGGIRIENSDVFGTKVAPRGAVSVQVAGEHGPLTSTFLRASAGRGITEPSLVQNFSRTAFYVGNPDLRPERTNSYEAGVVQEWFGRRLRTEVAAFHNSFNDLIVFVSLPPPVFGSWDNVERSWARGLEFSGRARLASDLHVSGAYTRLYTRITHSNDPSSLFTGIGQELARRPRNSGSLSISFAPRRWSGFVGCALVGERQDTDFLGVSRNSGYQNVYAGGSWNLHSHVTPFLRVDNLLNSRYEEALGYSSLSRTFRGGVQLGW
ncbi:MAG TPA: TonB-dependent receptor [Bryobacteraceae bacterium]|nr:TonB-dependent receptor [Bryobacteraceae bacterium]